MVTDEARSEANEDETGGGEVAGLRAENEALTRELKSRDAAIIGLEQALAARDAEIADLKKVLEDAERTISELGKALPQAVAAYKAMVVQANQGILPELIAGETVEEVNESLKNAQALVNRVRQEMEAEASRTRIPAGAPQRVPLDMSTLTPREKIQYAVGGSSS